jgi:TolB-like protein/DNA-binding SARP family transcriptional activator
MTCGSERAAAEGSPVIELRTLGVLDVRDSDGRELQPVLAQPKRLALLVYLALARPRPFHRRDAIVAFFWPELDQDHARGALRVALRFLRRQLGESVLVSRTEDELGVDTEELGCDALRFEQACEAGQLEEALALYRGDLLEGVFIADASPDLERWMDTERARLRTCAARAAWQLTERHFDRGDPSLAADWARRAADLSPDDEEAQRRLIILLDRVGDRAGAVHVYEAFARRLVVDHQVEPSPETQALIRAIRCRAASSPPLSRPAPPTRVASSGTAGRAPVESRELTAAELGDAIADVLPGPTTGSRRLKLRLVAVSLVVLMVGLFLWTLRREGAVGAASSPTLIVLPFQNLGAASDRYFADGITEEITTRLTAITSLRVIGRASANAYQNTSKPPEQIGRELGAQYVLEGTIRTDRARGTTGQARVAPQLIRVADGTNLWAEAYTVALTPGAIFDAQAKIAEKVAQALKITLLGSERAALAAQPTANTEAYDAYLRGNDYLRRGVGQNWRAQRIAEQMYQRATRLDPQFALAYAGLAATHWQMYYSTYDMSMTPHLTFTERLARVKEAADQALKLEPSLPDLHRTLARYFQALGDSENAERQLELWWRAAANDPQAIVEQGARQAAQGEWRAAQASVNRAMQLDPRSVSLIAHAGEIYGHGGRYREAESYYDRWIALAPDDPQPYGFKAWLHLLQGDTAGARQVLKGGAVSVGLPNLLAAIAHNSVQINMLRILPDYGAVVQGLSVESFDNDTVDYLYAKVLAYWSQPERARAYWDSTRVWCVTWIRHQPELSFQNRAAYLSLADAAAALGQREEANESIRDVDRIEKGHYACHQGHCAGEQGLIAEVYVMSGEPEAAIDRLALALHDPLSYSPALLRLDPIWEPLKGNPRFQALLKVR